MSERVVRRDASDYATTATPQIAPAKFNREQRLTASLLLGASFMLSVDFSILNVALPKIGAGVGLTLSQLPWVITAYALPAAGTTLLFGRIADDFGRRRVFLTGIALLAVASVFGGFATNAVALLVARALQGLATAIATPAALALLITSFSDENQRSRVLGLNGALLSGGFTVGALAGGALVTALSWRAAFLINVPVAVVIFVATPFLVRASSASTKIQLDIPGAATVTLGLVAFAFGVTNRNLYSLIVGLVLLAIFWQIELRSKAPLAAVNIMSKPTVRWGNLGALTIFAMESALIFLMTLYLQDVLGFSPLATGLTFGPPGLASVAAGIFAGGLIAQYGKRQVLVAGMVLQAAFTATLLLLGASRISLWILVPSLFFGFYGHVTAIVASLATATSDVADADQGLATGLASMTQQIAITIGIPILSAITAMQEHLLDGVRLALLVDVVLTVIAAILIWVGLSSRSEQTRVQRPRHLGRFEGVPLLSIYPWPSAYERFWSRRLDLLARALQAERARDATLLNSSVRKKGETE